MSITPFTYSPMLRKWYEQSTRFHIEKHFYKQCSILITLVLGIEKRVAGIIMGWMKGTSRTIHFECPAHSTYIPHIYNTYIYIYIYSDKFRLFSMTGEQNSCNLNHSWCVLENQSFYFSLWSLWITGPRSQPQMFLPLSFLANSEIGIK